MRLLYTSIKIYIWFCLLQKQVETLLRRNVCSYVLKE